MPEHSSPSPAEMRRIPAIHPQVAATHVDGQATIVLVDSSQILALNDVGAFLWDRCDGRRSLADLAAALQSEYEVSPGQARQDTLALIERLVELGALKWVAGGE